MKCLIIAAGLGSRLAGKGDSKPLVKLGGIPLIEHVLFNAMEAGIAEFFIVLGYNVDKLKKRLTYFSQIHSVKIDYIYNENWKEPNGVSVLTAGKKFKEPFFLLMSDHLFYPSIIKNLQAEGIGSGEVILAVDKRIDNNFFVDIDDVTKVLEVDNFIQDIGKTISTYNAFDTGIFMCSPAIFDALELSINKGNGSLSGGIYELSGKQKAKTFDIGDHNWIDVDDDRAFKKAEKYLMEIIGGNNI